MKWRWLRSYPFWICVTISTLIWYFFYLTNNTKFRVKVRLEYINVPDNFILTKTSSDYVNVIFNVPGEDVNNVKSQLKNFSVFIDLADVDFIDKKKINYTFSPSLAVKNQLKEYLDGFNDYEITKDSISIVLESSVSKCIPIKDDFEYTVNSGYMELPDSGFSVDSVIISGTASAIDNIDYISIGRKMLGKLSKSYVKIIEFENYFPDIQIDPPVVTYSVKIAEFTEAFVKLNINDYTSEKYEFFPDSITIKYHVALHDYSFVAPSMFRLNVVFPETNDDENYNKAYIELETYPDFINIIYINPYIVEYLMF